MKVMIVLVSIIAVAAADAINRLSGWGSPLNIATINIDLAAAGAAVGSGNAAGGQALLEIATGNIDGPAYLSSMNGILSAVNQGEDISQISTANKPSGAASSINAVDTENQAVAVDTLTATLGGAYGATVQNAANTDSIGEGSSASEAITLNDVQELGWGSK